MRWLQGFGHAARRRGYQLAMYTGVRALVNRTVRGARVAEPRLAALAGRRFAARGLGELVLRVHLRRRTAPGAGLGYFSLRQAAPSVGPLAYRYFCWTSHFGCGHVEVAFRLEESAVVFLGVRNIAHANARRLGLRGLAERFRLARSREDHRVLHALAEHLRANGLAVRHAPAEACVDLLLDGRLVSDTRRSALRRALQRKYERLHAAFSE